MAIRDGVHAIGRVLTRVLLHPRWRGAGPMSWTYLRLYLLGKRFTERHELSTIQGLLSSGMTVVDVGANVGFYTLTIAASVGPTGRVIAFEPDPFCFDILKSRIRRFRLRNIEAQQLAIGDRTGEVTLFCSAYNRADNRLHPTHDESNVEAHHVQMRSLDSVLAEKGALRVDAMKIDVQGAEEHVLKGAQRTLRSGLKWIWIEFSPAHLQGAGTDPKGFLAALAGLSMGLHEVDAHGRLRPMSDVDDYVRRIGSGYGDLVLLGR
jgi:FkbM family methyltransferase